jgi:hypothetical protein
LVTLNQANEKMRNEASEIDKRIERRNATPEDYRRLAEIEAHFNTLDDLKNKLKENVK